MDVMTKEQRRKNMQHIRSQDTRIEVLLRKALWAKGYRYRKMSGPFPGNRTSFLPDIKSPFSAMESFFTEKTGKFCARNWRKAITASSGLVKFPATGNGMTRSTKSFFSKAGPSSGSGAKTSKNIPTNVSGLLKKPYLRKRWKNKPPYTSPGGTFRPPNQNALLR